jgi:arsenite-transporting ATPase
VVAEAERTATTLSLFGYAVDAIIANRVLPDEVRDPYLAGWKARQADHLATIHERFAPLPVLQVPLLGDEPIGVDGLAPIAEAAYASLDERDVLHDGRPVRLDTDGDGHLLRIALPHTSREDVELHRRAGDLHVKVAGVRRTIPLPAVVQHAEVVGAGLVDGWLEIRLAVPAAAGAS